jgi:hypothetical protein
MSAGKSRQVRQNLKLGHYLRPHLRIGGPLVRIIKTSLAPVAGHGEPPGGTFIPPQIARYLALISVLAFSPPMVSR